MKTFEELTEVICKKIDKVWEHSDTDAERLDVEREGERLEQDLWLLHMLGLVVFKEYERRKKKEVVA